jgi:hypothetical protein
MVKTSKRWYRISRGMAIKGAVSTFSLILLAIANGKLFAQDQALWGSENKPCPDHCLYCPGGKCTNAEVHPFAISDCVHVTANYWCPAATTKSEVYVLTPEVFQALQNKPVSQNEFDEERKAAATNNAAIK